MTVEILETAFDPYARLAAYQAGNPRLAGGAGACAVFVGSMRDHNEGETVERMTLEHYPGMTERQIERLVDARKERSSLLDALVVHRVGDILPADTIVLVAVWSAHRAASFDACRDIMEALKSTAPFWKHETLADGSRRWVGRNTPDR